MTRTDARKFHFIYKTTCNVTGRWYKGMHSTDNLEDGYIGSGKRLWHSINKHGRENHSCEILEFLPDRKAPAAREKEIVNEETLKEELCMNLKVGGVGGAPIGSCFWTKEQQIKCTQASVLAGPSERGRKLSSERMSRTSKRLHEEGIISAPSFTGCSHSEETKKKIGLAQVGKKKHNFGKKYACVTKNEITKRVFLEELNIYLLDGWVRGMKPRK